MTSAAKFLGEQRPELQHPTPDRFVGDVQPALGQQIFDIAEASAILLTKETPATVGVTKPLQVIGLAVFESSLWTGPGQV